MAMTKSKNCINLVSICDESLSAQQDESRKSAQSQAGGARAIATHPAKLTQAQRSTNG
jgi:hypothetical protein